MKEKEVNNKSQNDDTMRRHQFYQQWTSQKTNSGTGNVRHRKPWNGLLQHDFTMENCDDDDETLMCCLYCLPIKCDSI